MIQDAYILNYLVQDFDLELTPEIAVQFVNRAYKIRQPLVDNYTILKFRELDKGATDIKMLKNLFDPKGKDSGADMQSGEFMNTDWKPCPMVQSLNRITRNYIVSTSTDIKVDGVDKLSIDKKIRKRQEQISKRYATDLINFIGSFTGDLPIEGNDIDKMGEDETQMANPEVNLMEQIKSELDDDWHFHLLSDIGALKDGVESSHEIMIRYYMESLKFKERIAYDIISDIMKVRAFTYRFYTSAMDGTPQVAYIDPASINTSPFREKDGRDMDYWYYEFTVSWADYMKMVGGKLPKEKNQAIYHANRTAWYPDLPLWNDDQKFYYALFNTKIRMGYFEMRKHKHDDKTGKYYDVIKKFYYLPLMDSNLALDPNFILDLGDLQDMTRHGGQLQFAKFSLVVFKDNKYQSWYEIQEPDLLRLNILYQQYLNTATSIIPRGVNFAEETLKELVEDMLNAKREEMNERGHELTNESGEYQKMLRDTIRKFKARGNGIFKRREGQLNERQLDPPTQPIAHSLYEDLTQLVNQMMAIYNIMITSLGTNPVTLGQAPKQNQTVRGIEMASQGAMSMIQEMIEMYKFGLTEFGSRMIYYDKEVSKEFNDAFEGKTARAEQMKSIIGKAGIGWLEIYKDMYVQDCSMLVEDAPTDEQRLMLFDYAFQLEQAGRLPIGTALMVQEIKNYKLAKLFVLASEKRQQRIATENQMQLMQQQQQAQMQNQQVAVQSQAALKQNEAELEARLVQLENQLKQQGMSQNIAERGANRERENEQRTQLDIEKKRAEKDMETY